MADITSQEKDQQNKASCLAQLIEHPRVVGLAAGGTGAPVLTVNTLNKDVDEADFKSLKGVYRLPEHGELDLVFTHPGGVDVLTARQLW